MIPFQNLSRVPDGVPISTSTIAHDVAVAASPEGAQQLFHTSHELNAAFFDESVDGDAFLFEPFDTDDCNCFSL